MENSDLRWGLHSQSSQDWGSEGYAGGCKPQPASECCPAAQEVVMLLAASRAEETL